MENRGKSGIKINKNISSPHPGQIQDILQTLAVENNLGLVLLFFFFYRFQRVTSANKLLFEAF